MAWHAIFRFMTPLAPFVHWPIKTPAKVLFGPGYLFNHTETEVGLIQPSSVTQRNVLLATHRCRPSLSSHLERAAAAEFNEQQRFEIIKKEFQQLEDEGLFVRRSSFRRWMASCKWRVFDLTDYKTLWFSKSLLWLQWSLEQTYLRRIVLVVIVALSLFQQPIICVEPTHGFSKELLAI